MGKVFLEKTEKPYYACVRARNLYCTRKGAYMRPLQANDTVELLEGPKRETLGSLMRLKCKAVQDGREGWITMKEKQGLQYLQVAEGAKRYICTTATPITDGSDINTSKVLGKLVERDLFIATEAPFSDESTGITRVKGATKDGIEGWITIRSNTGSTYAWPTSKSSKSTYKVNHKVDLQESFASNSRTIRNLTPGEIIDVSSEPVEEVVQSALMAKV